VLPELDRCHHHVVAVHRGWIRTDRPRQRFDIARSIVFPGRDATPRSSSLKDSAHNPRS
jgi:hypothetical protein